jgi:Fic-DOC domain mobile mystery protein B
MEREMTDPLAEQDEASTPLSSEEREGLIPSYITLRGELNEAEQANILEGDAWAFSRRRDVLDERFLNTLHERMYGNVWRWAGTYRKSQKNIGIEYYKIPTELRALLDDCSYWVKHNIYSPDEIAARFHHRLVTIHCYPNGNGRHARLARRSVADAAWPRTIYLGKRESRRRRHDARKLRRGAPGSQQA